MAARLPLVAAVLPLSAAARAHADSAAARLAAALLLLRPELGSLEAAAAAMPRGWETHGDLVLLPASAFRDHGENSLQRDGETLEAEGVLQGENSRQGRNGENETKGMIRGDTEPASALSDQYVPQDDSSLLENAADYDSAWARLGDALWTTVAAALRCRRVARQGRVVADGQRHSGVEMLLGSNGWVRHVDNSVVYTWDVTRCMFSRGNITEKLRVASLPCAGETVVDLYAGIGYFTLPYLVHAGAFHVHACEWNPEAVAALRRNLALNKV